ncbi:MAG: HD domain-containing protein [Spirochaetaceae bacterium]|nr:HD domain-containing protein [Spirochaetaceae bacterium]
MTKEREYSSDRLNRILDIDRELDRIKDLDLLLERLLLLARREANADAGTVYICNNDQLDFTHTQNDTFQAELKPDEKLIYSFFSIPISDKSISGFVANHETILNIPDMYNISSDASYHFDPSFDKKTGYKTVSSLTFPLVSSDGDLLGVMQLLNARGKNGGFVAFKPEDEPFFEIFARFGSKAIQRAQMTRNLLITITGFAGLRDPKETGAHVNRVGSFSMEIYEAWAKRRNLDTEEREKNKDILRMAAMLHDVGKVGISDIILKKPGKFDDDEYRIMQSHTWLGARQFLDKSELNTIAQEVALYHHENWDGSGYPGKIGDLFEADKYIRDVEERPAGFKGEEIPIFARVVAIADVYDALCSKRVYKEAWDEEDALKVMKEESGRKFDPELIDAFFSILPTLGNIRERYQDSPED